MINLNKPNVDMDLLANICIDSMNNGDRKNRLQASKSEISQSVVEYDDCACNGQLYTIREHDVLKNGATKDDMKYLYECRFVQGPGRDFYNAIMLLAPNKKCPYCGHRDATTLDHYMPKSKYPTYAITSTNLIPSCGVCNHIKNDTPFFRREDEVIHPYFDDFAAKDKWLYARVIEGDAIGFTFFVNAPDTWSKEKIDRITYHFRVFELNKLYQLNAADEFVPCFGRVKRIYKRGGKKAAVEELKDDIKDRDELRKNTWQAAMYKALIDSEWFWNEYVPSNIV